VNEKLARDTTSIETIVSQCNVFALRDQPPLIQAVSRAKGMKELREMLTESVVNLYFMPLQGTPLGFLTDKDQSGGYSWEVVRDVVIEALLRGFHPINNEFNIIAGRFYGAKNGFDRIVHTYEGVRNLQISLGVPQMAGEKGALVPCEARWMYNGKQTAVAYTAGTADTFDTRIPVKVNGGMGADAILGKATRKLYARIYQQLTGCGDDVIESDPLDLVPVQLPSPAEPAQDGRRIRMGGGRVENGATPKAEQHDPMTGEFPNGNGGM
jgi:hypothetical protein